MISAKNICKYYGDFQVLKNIDIEINSGEIVTILGASGAGKTTLLQILGTLLKFDSGSLEIDQKDISKLSLSELARFRNRNIGFVFQFHHLLPEFTALENVCIPAFIGKIPKKEAIENAKELLSFLNIENRMDHKPNESSGGEKQRIPIARALINKPLAVFADEPTGNLDSKNTRELFELFLSLRERYKQTFVIVTHNAELADMSDRKLIIVDGRIS